MLLANGEFDAGEPVATRGFRMRQAGKASLYRHEVRHAATEALLDAVAQILDGRGHDNRKAKPTPTGRARPCMDQSVRAIDWRTGCTDDVLRKIRAGEGPFQSVLLIHRGGRAARLLEVAGKMGGLPGKFRCSIVPFTGKGGP